MKLIRRSESQFDVQQARETARLLNLHPATVEVLFSRGVDTVEKIKQFINPQMDALLDPFALKGMRECVDRLSAACNNGERVVVYGDYDVDGICASYILWEFLTTAGAEASVYIPSRNLEGYGLSLESIERIIEEREPDLIITCDCGITSVDEVSHALDLGVDIIVTDHHEAAKKIPECVVVNPKQADCGYQNKDLCGAGVAFKVVEAALGIDYAARFLDLACLAAVADMVPLVGENRAFVKIGLERINRGECNKGLNMLIRGQAAGAVTAADLAFKIAPRINAAGRLGDAYRAFKLLALTDEREIDAIISDINADNLRRKDLCTKQYEEAVVDLAYEKLWERRAIILSNPNWEKGLTGILAARLAGEFRRPSFVLVDSGDVYKGTSRSIDSVNIYELLTFCSDLLIEYGGHRGAAGFSLKKEKRAEFCQRVEKYLEGFDEQCFMPQFEYDLCVRQEDITMDMVRSLELLEPFGISNPKPYFLIEADTLKIESIKHTHVNLITKSGLNIISFNCQNSLQFCGNNKKRLAVELSINTFSKECVKAQLKAFECDGIYTHDTIAQAAEIMLNTKQAASTPIFKNCKANEFDSLVDSPFGTLIIYNCAEIEQAKKQNNKNIIATDFIYASQINNYTRAVICPDLSTINLSYYNKIIFASPPINEGLIAYINKQTKAEVFVIGTSSRLALRGLRLDKETLNLCYTLLRPLLNQQFKNIFEAYNKAAAGKVSLAQFVLCYAVFVELGIVVEGAGTVFSFRLASKGVTPTDSAIYNRFLTLLGEGGGESIQQATLRTATETSG